VKPVRGRYDLGIGKGEGKYEVRGTKYEVKAIKVVRRKNIIQEVL
jgi:hypothetical protein